MVSTILLTGGAGFVGGAIIDQARKRHPEWKLVVADLKAPRDCPPLPKAVDYIQADVKDLDQCLNAVKQTAPDIILHAAGKVPGGMSRYSEAGRADVFAINVGGTANMLEAARRCGVRRLVFTGSCTAITDDLNHEYPNFNESVPIPKRGLVYGESKAAAEKLVLAANSPTLATTVLRPSVILGREDYQLVPAIHACIEKGETPFVIGTGDNLYDFTFVDNVAHAHILAAENLLHARKPSAAGHAINISNDQPITFRDFMLAIWAQFGHVPSYSLRVPAWAAGTMGAVAELYTYVTGSKTTLCRGSVKDAIGTRYADLTKAKEILGYAPIVDIWDGVRISCDALKKRIAEGRAPSWA